MHLFDEINAENTFAEPELFVFGKNSIMHIYWNLVKRLLRL
jgi:hypothetical protein